MWAGRYSIGGSNLLAETSWCLGGFVYEVNRQNEGCEVTTKAAPVLASRTFCLLLIGIVCALLPIAASTADAAPQGPWSTSGRIDGAIGGPAIATEGGSATVVWPTTDEGVLAATQSAGESEFSPIEQVSTGLPPGVNSGIASLGDGRLQAAWVSDDGSIRTATQTIGVG